MGRSRSRSRSPKRRDYTRRRSRSLSRERDVEKRRRFTERRRSRSRSRSPSRRYRRSRSRSRSPRRRRSRTPSPRRRRRSKSPSEEQAGGSHKKTDGEERPQIDESKLEDMSEDEIEMMKVMGFASFDSTKGKHVPGSSNAFAANIQMKRKYRQYMNRRGGFNRPLDFIA